MALEAPAGLDPRSFRALLDVWMQLLEQVHDELRVYTWQPIGTPDVPALWNWLLPSTWQIMDTARGRDTVNMTTRLALKHTDGEGDMDDLALYVDAFRTVVDPVLWTPGNPRVLAGTAYRAQRQTMQMEQVEIGGIPLLCVGFNHSFDQDRHIPREA